MHCCDLISAWVPGIQTQVRTFAKQVLLLAEPSLTKALFCNMFLKEKVSFTRAYNLVREQEREEDSAMSNGQSN